MSKHIITIEEIMKCSPVGVILASSSAEPKNLKVVINLKHSETNFVVTGDKSATGSTSYDNLQSAINAYNKV